MERAPGDSAHDSPVSAPSSDDGRLLRDWQTRLRSRLLAVPDHSPAAGRSDAQADSASRSAAALQPTVALEPAAALVPIVLRPDSPTVLLTVRSRHLRRHAGQISFPGGALERGDADAVAAAVRETGEEVGIAPRFIEPIGFLPDHVIGTGFRLTPVVALLEPGFTLNPARGEVEEVFELPLAFALASANYRLRRHSLRGAEQQVWELCYGARNIWGATARVLVSLRERLDEGER